MTLAIDGNALDVDPTIVEFGYQRFVGLDGNGDPIYQGYSWQRWIWEAGALTQTQFDTLITRFTGFAGAVTARKSDGTDGAATAKMRYPEGAGQDGAVRTDPRTPTAAGTLRMGQIAVLFTKLEFT